MPRRGRGRRARACALPASAPAARRTMRLIFSSSGRASAAWRRVRSRTSPPSGAPRAPRSGRAPRDRRSPARRSRRPARPDRHAHARDVAGHAGVFAAVGEHVAAVERERNADVPAALGAGGLGDDGKGAGPDPERATAGRTPKEAEQAWGEAARARSKRRPDRHGRGPPASGARFAPGPGIQTRRIRRTSLTKSCRRQENAGLRAIARRAPG